MSRRVCLPWEYMLFIFSITSCLRGPTARWSQCTKRCQSKEQAVKAVRLMSSQYYFVLLYISEWIQSLPRFWDILIHWIANFWQDSFLWWMYFFVWSDERVGLMFKIIKWLKQDLLCPICILQRYIGYDKSLKWKGWKRSYCKLMHACVY